MTADQTINMENATMPANEEVSPEQSSVKTEPKWTPGEWFAYESWDGLVSVIAKGGRHNRHEVTVARDVDKVDAYLISAAKEINEALGVMLALVQVKYGNLDQDVNEEVERALAARAKARGERS